MGKDFLTTAAFARLCRTTKATLFHYDHIGLLKPRMVMENGYRAYGFEQFFTFYLIDLLKQTGSSLAEITTFLKEQDKSNFLSLLEEKRAVIRAERLRLAQREVELESMILAGREALDLCYDQIHVGWQNEERLEVVPTAISEGSSEPQSSSTNFSQLIQVVCPNGELPPRPYGSILDMNLFPKGRFVESHYFCGASSATPPERLHIKPEGQYASLAHVGDFESQLETIHTLCDELGKRGMTVAGNCYCYDMLSTELFDSTARIMAGKYCVPIVPL